jgi:hypothetical protein
MEGLYKELRPSTYLERRVEYLLKLIAEDKLTLDHTSNIELRNELARDLYNIQRHPNGRITSTLSDQAGLPQVLNSGI